MWSNQDIEQGNGQGHPGSDMKVVFQDKQSGRHLSLVWRKLQGSIRLRALLVIACLSLSVPSAPSAHARVALSFHSFNGSVLWGRYPHAFIALDGTLDANGASVHENYGYTAMQVSPALLRHSVRGTLNSEEQKYLKSTNLHIKVTISDETYFRIKDELGAWRDREDERNYDLDRRNCVHFVARIATIAGFPLDVPVSLVRKPRAYLNKLVLAYPGLQGTTFK